MRNPSRRRPIHTAVLNALVLSVSVVFLSGCMAAPAPPVPATPVAVASPEPTVTPPVFASNDEALAAATAAFGEYQSMSNTIAHEGGADPERISDFAVGKVLESELGIYKTLSSGGLHLIGNLAFDSLSIQSADLESGEVVAYVCLDVSGTDVVDATGLTVVPPGRPGRYPIQVSLLRDSASDRLLVEKSDSWSGSNFC
ncbi:hypothetical protein SAMN05216368_103189 [Cryobacterium flavum]|uniref:Uncharacterized protein n=2 Tax=Cryobacterium flavum TaxID=1424659 RepID=A0A5E9FWK9_9MICO|nr:hypothetical protein SAMN05216368_103189 [Cryobacterium flavum]